MQQQPRSAFITGACGDIGRALARELASTGTSQLALCDLAAPQTAEPQLAELRGLGADVRYGRVDVTDSAAVEAFVAEADTAFDGIELCVANAGIVERGLLVDLPPVAWQRTLDVNLTGCFLTAQAAARAMQRRAGGGAGGQGGHIVLLSSWVQDLPREGIGAYCVSKSGLKMLAKCLALELGPQGIRVNLVAPGFVDAGLTGQNLKEHPERRTAMDGSIPLGHLISAADLARAIRLFCSSDAHYMTGATLLLDGGSSLYFSKPR
jgi:NAD(P)-dependent dehydrogenase (short-subunit alcohol dehydrogenase family)